MTRNHGNRLVEESGFAMAGLMMVVLLLLAFGAFTVLGTSLDQRASSHYDTSNRAFFAAESGVLRALNTMNGAGVIHFQNDVVNRWSTVYGTGTKSLSTDPNATYEVTVAADPTSPSTKGTLTVTGGGPLEAKRVIRVVVQKGGFEGAPGAIHLAADANVDAQFRGTSFEINGNNHNMLGSLTNDIVKPGISTRSQDVNDEVINSLSSGQKDNVQGLGFSSSPLTPSVIQGNGPSVSDLDTFVADLLGRSGVVTDTRHQLNGNDVFGTPATPQITYLTDADLQLSGNASGAGVLIVDGSITITGTLDFIGLIIVRGDTIIQSYVAGDSPDETLVSGDANIYGSLWTGNLVITVAGNATVGYCQECLQLIDNVGGEAGAVPRPMSVVSWGEVL